MAERDQTMPKVVDGKLDRPYPINSMADVSRARVLPPPRVPSRQPATREKKVDTRGKSSTQPDDTVNTTEQPVGAFDYVKKRNQMMRGISSRSGKRSATRRRA